MLFLDTLLSIFPAIVIFQNVLHDRSPYNFPAPVCTLTVVNFFLRRYKTHNTRITPAPPPALPPISGQSGDFFGETMGGEKVTFADAGGRVKSGSDRVIT